MTERHRVERHSGKAESAANASSNSDAAADHSMLDMLAASFIDELVKRDPGGERLKEVDVRQSAVMAAESILDPAVVWVRQLGAFYDTDGVRALLGRDSQPVSRQAVHKRKGLLALTTGNGRVVYPAFQFQGRKPTGGLDKVLTVLPENLVSRWTVASWLTSPEPDLDGDRPIDVLANDGPAGRARVIQTARSWSAQLAG